jgi:hypothetical protein
MPVPRSVTRFNPRFMNPLQRMGAAPGQARLEPLRRSPVLEAVVLERRCRIETDVIDNPQVPISANPAAE